MEYDSRPERRKSKENQIFIDPMQISVAIYEKS
jgi:hypothetical protein